MIPQFHSSYWPKRNSKDHVRMFIVALFISQKPEMQISINKKIDNKTVIFSYNEILLSNKGNELLIYAIIWMNLKNVMLNKSQDTRAHTIKFHFCKVLEQAVTLWWEKSEHGLLLGMGGLTKKGHEGSCWSDGNLFYLDLGERLHGCIHLPKFKTTHLKYVHLTVNHTSI